MSLPFSLFDSYQKQAITITPQSTVLEGTVKIYTCGPTVYNYQHIGNMRAVWLADSMVNMLKMMGYDTEWVLNITDVGHLVGDGDGAKNISTSEDKISKSAKSQNKTVQDIVQFYTNDYLVQTKALNFNLPDNMDSFQPDVRSGVVNPLASEYVEQQMVLALELLADNRAYILNDGIYFDSQANLDLQVPFSIIENNEGDTQFTGRDLVNTTKNPSDFALWKFVDENSLQKWKFYDYPLAINALAQCFSVEGRIMHKWGCPGWHSECVAMICSILGRKLLKKRESFSFADFRSKTIIDIHTGGEDHIDIHHKNEILQSEALGFHLSKYWVHNKFVLVDNKKMSKSVGNVFLVKGSQESTGFESIESRGYDPLSYRLMLHEHNYNTQLDFTWDKLTQSQTRLYNLRKEASKLKSFSVQCKDNFVEGFHLTNNTTELEWLAIVGDNLNLGRLLEVYTQLLNSVVNLVQSENILFQNDYNLLQRFDSELLKLNLFYSSVPKEVYNLARSRQKAKDNKDYQLSDQLRQEILAIGYQVDDYKWGWGLWIYK